MKQIYLDGFIGKDAEVCTTKGGKQYVRFSVANKTFANGESKTEWFDVTSYDQRVIENRVKHLTKGRYVVLNGGLNVSFSVKDGKVFLNQYVNANEIDTPVFGTKSDEVQPQAQTDISTFTKPDNKPAAEPVVVTANNSNNDDIDLPF